MIFKIQNIYLEADEICSISTIRKYSGSLFFIIFMKNKSEHEISWSISNNFDEEDVMYQKMQNLRRDIAKFKNNGVVHELGQAIVIKKTKETQTVPRALKKATR